MDCQFSEMQFVVGLLCELMNDLNPDRGWSAPFLPTQIKEKDFGI